MKGVKQKLTIILSTFVGTVLVYMEILVFDGNPYFFDII